jgi:hypothetical protein
LSARPPESEIFVRLIDEGVDVWRPVRAERLDDGVYRIVDQPYDRELETWQFGPDDIVVAEPADSSAGQILAATRRYVRNDAAELATTSSHAAITCPQTIQRDSDSHTPPAAQFPNSQP